MIEFSSYRWFNLHRGFIHIFGLRVKLFNAFNRVCESGAHYWGFGILQINRHHLFFVGYTDYLRVRLFFMQIYGEDD